MTWSKVDWKEASLEGFGRVLVLGTLQSFGLCFIYLIWVDALMLLCLNEIVLCSTSTRGAAILLLRRLFSFLFQQNLYTRL